MIHLVHFAEKLRFVKCQKRKSVSGVFQIGNRGSPCFFSFTFERFLNFVKMWFPFFYFTNRIILPIKKKKTA